MNTSTQRPPFAEVNSAASIPCHERAVNAVGVSPCGVYRVKKLRILVVGDFVFADAVGVGYRAKLAITIVLVRRVTRIADGGPVERDVGKNIAR